MQCAYCKTDTGGIHQTECPNNPINMNNSGFSDISDGVLSGMKGQSMDIYDTPPMPKVKDPKPEESCNDGCGPCGNKCDWFLERQSILRKEVISIQPGDVIVVTVEADSQPADFRMVQDAFEQTFPNNKILQLLDGMTMELYRDQGK